MIKELEELRALTGDESGAQRVAWTDTWLKAREWFTTKLAGLPVEDHYDAAGNRWITLHGESPKALILGSHLDSVPNGGWLDGCLGVLTALDVLRSFGDRPPVTIRLVDFADEEGARFGRSLLGSSAFAGTHSIGADRGRLDKNGIRLEDALATLWRSNRPFPRSAKRAGETQRRIWNSTSSRVRCSKRWACRLASCSARRASNVTRLRSTGRRRIRARRR
jgi:N-carbamoyl-L-amino-acid hydrolase